jgi:hypothetical protein
VDSSSEQQLVQCTAATTKPCCSHMAAVHMALVADFPFFFAFCCWLNCLCPSLPPAGSEPGYALVDDKGKIILGLPATGTVIAGARPCPQSYYCSGGDPAVTASQLTKCSTVALSNAVRLWTEGEGATSAEDCVAPPGYSRTSTTPFVAECASGTYKNVSGSPCDGTDWLLVRLGLA